MTVAAVDPVVGDVMFMTERDRLAYGLADLGHIRRPHVHLEGNNQERHAHERAAECEPSQRIRTWTENLRHLTCARGRRAAPALHAACRDRRRHAKES